MEEQPEKNPDPIIRDKKGRISAGSAGRPVGAVGHLTKTVKETVLAVFQEIQDDPKISLKAFAEKYPRDFYQIAARLIPTDIRADVRLNKVILEIVRTTTTPDQTFIEDTAPTAAESN